MADAPASSNLRCFDGRCPQIAGDAWIDPTALLIGAIELGTGSSIWPMVTVRGDIHRIRIGAGSNIQDGSVLHVTHDGPYAPGGHPLAIGDRVTVGHHVTLHGCEIGDLCLIGMGSVVLDGAILEPEVMLGAGSLVTPGKRLSGGYLWLGAPVRRVRQLSAQEQAYLAYSADNYRKLAARHRHNLEDPGPVKPRST
jgi:carbonic anhydrase/acetyltransferase-like protein (isoleucine patch superfamily)